MGSQGKIARTQSRKKFLFHLTPFPIWTLVTYNPKKFLRPNHNLICSKTLVKLKKLFLFVYECEIRTEPEIKINFYFMALLLCTFVLITSNVL